MGPCVLGPSHEVEDKHHEQDDDEKTDQSVAGSGDGKHVALPVVDAKKLPLLISAGGLYLLSSVRKPTLVSSLRKPTGALTTG